MYPIDMYLDIYIRLYRYRYTKINIYLDIYTNIRLIKLGTLIINIKGN